jgi:hypothetical protein
MTTKAAALFVDPKGPYANRPDVDALDESRDARNYRGEHNRPGNDGGCFVSALKSVRVWCGVLEHPAYSRAFEKYGIRKPTGMYWELIGAGTGKRQHWVCEVCQAAYGHRAQKRTWLYYVGFSRPAPMDFCDVPGTHQCGWFDRKKPTLGKREALLTPPAFAEALIQLALGSRL